MICRDMEQALVTMKLELPEKTILAFELLASELKKWNRKVNLTALQSDSDIAIKHMVDSIVFANRVSPGEMVLDVGSGAGFPAIPLKIVCPDTRVISVDAVGKKIMFQRHVARLLGLTNFEAIHSRVEDLHSTHEYSFDVISSRAFSSLDAFVSLAAPLLKPGGRIIAMKGPDVHSEITEARDSLQHLGYEISDLFDYSLPMQKGNRCLVTIKTANAYK